MKYLLPLFSVFLLFACTKEGVTTDSSAKLRYLSPSIEFDTVFTAAGTTTKIFTISNPNNKAINISEIRLMGLSNSPFSINVNGIAGPVVNNITVNAEDSIYLFLKATVNPNDSLSPFLIEDSLQVSYNGNHDIIKINAYGQNAVYMHNNTILSDTTWSSSLPIILFGDNKVSEGHTLTIAPGTKLYFHQGSGLQVMGTLLAAGSFDQQITMMGDRLDDHYIYLPGSWHGLSFTATSQNNELKFVQIKNATTAVYLEGLPSAGNSKLSISQSMIMNSGKAGIHAVNAAFNADNLLMANNNEGLKIEKGGRYDLLNSTIANYSTNYALHNLPGTSVSNYLETDGVVETAALNANFTNTIFWGDRDDEFVVAQNTNAAFEVNMSHCIYKALTEPAGPGFLNCFQNQDPQFDNIEILYNRFDFHISDPFSIAIDTGTPVSLDKDLDNNPRIVNNIDIGCYELQ